MARSRNIKPGFFCNEDLSDIEPHGRLLFIGLWTLADKDGLLEYRVRRIKAQLFPYESVKVEKLLEDLVQADFIEIYANDEQKYISIMNWDKHQNPHKNEKVSVLPKPNKINGIDIIPVKDGTSTDKIGKAQVITPDSFNLIPDSFNPIWVHYPKRSGANPKKKAEKALNARLKEGIDIKIIEAGVKRYKAFCEATGKIGTEYIMQAATFFGPDRHFENQWEIPKVERKADIEKLAAKHARPGESLDQFKQRWAKQRAN